MQQGRPQVVNAMDICGILHDDGVRIECRSFFAKEPNGWLGCLGGLMCLRYRDGPSCPITEMPLSRLGVREGHGCDRSGLDDDVAFHRPVSNEVLSLSAERSIAVFAAT